MNRFGNPEMAPGTSRQIQIAFKRFTGSQNELPADSEFLFVRFGNPERAPGASRQIEIAFKRSPGRFESVSGIVNGISERLP